MMPHLLLAPLACVLAGLSAAVWAVASLRTGRARQFAVQEKMNAVEKTLEHIDQGILTVDAGGSVVVYNQRVVTMLGLPDDLLPSQPLFADVLRFQMQSREFSRTDGPLLDAIRAGGITNFPVLYERERPDGSTLEVRTQSLPGGEMVRTFTDITERKRAQALVERAALHDELTGLPTRLALQRRLDQWLAEAPAGARAELLYLNLDRFRLLNDARGHEVGDRLLADVAYRLRAACPAGSFVSRVGGDEFAVLQSQPEPGFADRLRGALAEPYVIDGDTLSITASIGVVAVEPGAAASVLLRNADIALNRAKDAGRNQVSHYTPSMSATRQDRFHLEQSLRHAVGSDAFHLAYQPIVAVGSRAVIGYEALLRWTDRDRGEVSPASFIPMAEATGLIVPLGRSVLEWACFEAASWPNERTIAVNLSPAQFGGDHLVETVRETLHRSGLAPGRLELEVTEGMVLEGTGSVVDTMNALREIGVRLTLDDFGAGHAGLSYLRRFPFQKMKIDQSFVRTLGDAGSDAIIEAILLLGQRLGMGVVAEGVETEAQLRQLEAMRCPFVQGHLTGRPMSAEQARSL